MYDKDPSGEDVDTTVVGAESDKNTGVQFNEAKITGVPAKSQQVTIQQAEQLQRGTMRPRMMQQVQAPNDYNMLNYEIEELEHTALTQYSVKKGLQIFGRDGAEAVLSEMQQLHEMKAIEQKAALEYLMFLKKKQCGRIKGRGCADGRKQRLYKSKEDTSSPTARTESLFLSSILDAKEGCHVVTCDIPGTFLQAEMDETIIMRLAGPLTTLLTKVNKKLCSKFVVMERGKPVIYVRLARALYGTLQASLLLDHFFELPRSPPSTVFPILNLCAASTQILRSFPVNYRPWSWLTTAATLSSLSYLSTLLCPSFISMGVTKAPLRRVRHLLRRSFVSR